MYNLLTQPLIRTLPRGVLTLPGVIAALARDEVEDFPGATPASIAGLAYVPRAIGGAGAA